MSKRWSQVRKRSPGDLFGTKPEISSLSLSLSLSSLPGAICRVASCRKPELLIYGLKQSEFK